ncbi:hypothetical protein [Devosia nitrariae]|uniref:Carboxypeptidase regulatory-like domain-containing protein n=1 Tax=Devosia nitrariae TaxID=2071872 RepID=A0ABQ5W839_9HYPH|nr:hypothetical protein [Devosia nitrariae]GLQ56115.1 hypothetical protein GCM10010862_33740 [Devosia nitrariae]
MANNDDTVSGSPSLTVTVGGTPVNAGADLIITASVICDPPCDLTGDHLLIRDNAGAQVGLLLFTGFESESAASTGSITLSAPDTLGDCIWSAELPAFAADDLQFAATTAPLAFAVCAHKTRVNVWGTPSAVPAGGSFRSTVGVKCACGCDLAGQAFTIHDQTGREVAAGTLGPDVWPESEALYHADVELPAAATPGRQTWEARFAAAGLDLPHAAGTAQFGVIFTPHAEHVVQIEAVDAASKAPLVGAVVMMHPYRALTDERGMAELRVPKGTYTLFVSARRHVSDRASIEVDGDVATRARLAVEVRSERL